jgi:cell wall assembly regulator SMI1
MIDLLRELEAELVRAAPPSAAALRPGLAADQIDELLSSLPHPIPDELPALYAWHDGTEEVQGAYRAEIYRGGMFLPLEEALANRAGGMEGAAGYWDERWLPLFTDEHALFDAVVCGPGGGQIVSFSYVDLPDFDVVYRSISDFVRSLVRRWQLGVYSMNEWGGVHLDRRALGALRREEDGDEPDVPALVRSLRDGGETEWLAALVRLRTRLYPTAVPALIDMLLDPTAGRRTYAAEVLGVIGGAAAADALRRTAETDHDELVRQMAAVALRDMEPIGQ